MRCAELVPLLTNYANGRADERGRRIIERHIQLCDRCRERIIQTGHLGQQLSRLSLLPSSLVDRLPRLRRDLELRLARRAKVSTYAMYALAVLLLTLVGILVMLYLGR